MKTNFKLLAVATSVGLVLGTVATTAVAATTADELEKKIVTSLSGPRIELVRTEQEKLDSLKEQQSTRRDEIKNINEQLDAKRKEERSTNIEWSKKVDEVLAMLPKNGSPDIKLLEKLLEEKGVNALEVKLDKLSEEQELLKRKKTELKDQQKKGKTAVSEQQDKLKKARKGDKVIGGLVSLAVDVDNIERRLFDVDTGVAEHDEKFEQIQDDIEDVYGAVGDVSSDLRATKANVAQNAADIAENAEAIKIVDGNVEKVANTVSLVQDDVEENTNKIGELSSDLRATKANVAQNAARIDKLHKDLKRGLATQAALQGLFQPYSVGKFNVTAAVGGYKSEVALAVGTGYRFNAKLATKAGIAFNKGGVSYNVGVNYEF